MTDEQYDRLIGAVYGVLIGWLTAGMFMKVIVWLVK